MKVINLYGGPGTGKSTTAARLFSEMKVKGYNVELITEFAKDLTWHGRHTALTDQLYVLGQQHHKIYMLKDKVDYIITDSPLLLTKYYIKYNGYSNPDLCYTISELALDLYEAYDTIDILLRRSKEYNPAGRNQTEAEAIEIDYALEDILDWYVGGSRYKTFGTDEPEIYKMLEYIYNV